MSQRPWSVTHARESNRRFNGRFGTQLLRETAPINLLDAENNPRTPSLVKPLANRLMARLEMAVDDVYRGRTPEVLTRREQLIEAVSMDQNGRQMLPYVDLGPHLDEARVDELIDNGRRRARILLAHEEDHQFKTMKRIDVEEARQRLPQGSKVESFRLDNDSATNEPVETFAVSDNTDETLTLTGTDDHVVCRSWTAVQVCASDGAIVVSDDTGIPRIAYLVS